MLFETTYRGLFYAVKIESDACHWIGGYIPPNNGEVELADPGDSDDKTCMSGATWSFFVTFYIGPTFVQPTSPVSFESKLNAHGIFRISGASGDIDERLVQVGDVKANGAIYPQ